MVVYDKDRFSAFLLRRGNKRSTIGLTLRTLDRLFSSISKISKDEIDKYFVAQSTKGLKGSYLNHYVDALRLYQHCFKTHPFLLEIEYFKEKEAVKATMSDSEIEAFLALPAKRKGAKEIRNHAKWTLFFSIMAFTGMRCGEVAHLKIESVDFGRDVFSIEDTKTNTPRLVPIPPNLQKELHLYLQSCKDYLFPAPRGGKDGVVRSVDWGYQFHQRRKRLNIVRPKLTPYSLRHSYITSALSAEIDVFRVQRLAGHKDLKTTLHYTHLTTRDLIASIRKIPLIRKHSDSKYIKRYIAEMLRKQEVDKDNRFFVRLEETDNALRFELVIK